MRGYDNVMSHPRTLDLTLALATIVVAAVGVTIVTHSLAGGAIAIAGGVVAILLLQRRLRPPPHTRNDDAALIDGIAEPTLLIESGRVAGANTAARALLGAHVVGEDARFAIRHPIAAARLSGDEGEERAPVHLPGFAAREQHWELRVAPIGGSRRLVQLVNRTQSLATDRIRVDFVANASHELRTPLASLLGFIETLRDEAGQHPGTRGRFLGLMDAEARRMQRLVDDLMSLSRIEASQSQPPDQPVDLAALARQVCAELSTGNPARGGDLHVELSEVAPVRGDPAQMSQLLHNIVGNAMKYGRAGTPVTIAITPAEGAMARLTVTDQGDGIPAKHLPRLTERFYRVDRSRSRSIGGTGLGLAIVKHIVERHRGQLEINSVVGQGTEVTVRLPTDTVTKS